MTFVFASLGYAAAYALLGVVLLIIGFVALDVLTPGHLAKHIWTERSVNAGIVLSAGVLAQRVVVFFANWLYWSAGFGLLGVLMQALAFLLIELATPHRMGEVVTTVQFHPASLVIAAAQIAVSLAVVASIA